MALQKGQSGYRQVYREYKYRCKKRGTKFELTFVEFVSLTTKNCHYCNEKPEQKKIRACRNLWVPPMHGIDRIDNGKGYYLENCVPCCRMCNRMKSNFYLSEFLDKVVQIYRKFMPLD